MKKILLSIQERFYALRILQEFKGAHDVLAFILDDIKQFPFSEEEKKELELKEESLEDEVSGGKKSQVTWNPKKEKEKEFMLQEATIKYILDSINKGTYTIADRPVLSLEKKLKG